MALVATDAFPIIHGYQITEQLHEGSQTAVYRAMSEARQRPVVLKIMKSHYPSFRELVQVRNQYILTQNLQIPGVVTPLSLESWQNGYVLVMEDDNAIALHLYRQQLSCQAVLKIALQLAAALHGLCQSHIIHKDIKPANILIHPETQQVKLIDFSIASLLPREQQEIHSPDDLEGTLAYLSPEQTGRMNRGVDYRTDFYSLGVTLYELLTGERPFQSEDAMELVHCHLAHTPKLPQVINAHIPPQLSHLVLKLMAKNAEDRYQSALGLKHDLEICLEQLQSQGEIAAFELGERDSCDRFSIPEKLYGRQAEVQSLLDAFERVAQGRSELMLVSGLSGIGKTAVVNEVHKPITRQRGYFIKGKFDQFNRNIPFSAFVQAFRSLMGQLLGESDIALAQWKTRILEAVGDNGQVLIEVIPELEHVISCQPEVPKLSGAAAQNRFNLLFGQFIQVFTTPDHPLVIFLDDLQWADSASLNMLKLLMHQSEAGYLLVLGAYRDNEVFPAHPLMLTLAELERLNAPHTLTLKPLSQSDITQWVADMLLCSSEMAVPLSQLVHQKTEGNPFFTTQFLQGLHDDAYIYFDADVRSWQCDLTQIRQAALTDDVVAFMVRRLRQMPIVTQDVLKIAACIGNRFELTALAVVCEQSQEEVAANLWRSLQMGLVIPESETYKFFQTSHNVAAPEDIAVCYRFLHDRVQQAAYALIPEGEKQAIHLRIGQRLLQEQSVQGPPDSEELFAIVGQLNMGRDLLTTPAERNNLAQLNLQAGCKAKTSTAYAAAADYLNVAQRLLPSDSWTCDYQKTLDIFVETLEVEYLNTHFKQVDALAERILLKTQSLLDQIKVYEVQIRAWVGRGDQHQALTTGLNALNLLKVPLLTSKPDPVADVAELTNAPAMLDPYQLAAMNIMAYMITPAWAVSPDDFKQITFTMVDLSLKHGNCAASTFGYIWYGTLLCESFGEIDEGYAFGRLAVSLLEQFEAREFRSKVLNLYASCISFWQEHIRASFPVHRDGIQSGLETGDLEFACYSAAEYSHYLLLAGVPLDEVREEAEQKLAIIEHLKQTFHLDYIAPLLQTTLNLLGNSDDPALLVGAVYDETEHLPRLIEQKQLTTVFVIAFQKSFLSYLFGNFAQAVENGKIARDHCGGVAGTFFIPAELFYSSLARIACAEGGEVFQQSSERQNVDACLTKLKHWAKAAPMNYQHKCDLLEAELARCDRNFAVAIERYDLAIVGAKESEYLQEEALANELAAKFYLDWGKEKVAASYMQDAYNCYARWGGKAKIKDLERQYPRLLQPILQQVTPAFRSLGAASIGNLHQSSHSLSTATVQGYSFNTTFDIAAVFKGTQVLSNCLHLEDLLEQLTQIMLQNSGADRLVLLLPDTDGSWNVKVTATPETTQLLSDAFAEAPNLPSQLIQYVRRTKETVTIDNLETDLPIIDEYLQTHQPCSVVCLPLVYQDHLRGLLYLQNQATAGVFTCDRITVLNVLCSQAAISLANAQLYRLEQDRLKLLKASENRLRALFNQASDAIFLLGEQGFIDCNQAAVALLQYPSKADLLALQPRQISPERQPDGQRSEEKAKLFFREALQRCNLRFEWVHQRCDGTVFWTEITLTPIRYAGEIIFHCIVRDISDRKAAVDNLRASEQRYATLAAAVPVGIFRTDAAGNCIYVNDRWCQIAGVTSADAIGQGWRQGLYLEDRDLISTEWYQSAQENRPFQLEYRFQKSDGTVTWVYGQSVAEQDVDGQVIGYVGTITDIGDQKCTEAALHLSEARARATFDQAAVGLLEVDVQTQQCTRVNDFFCNLIGYTRAELLDMTVADLTHPEDILASKALLKQLYAGKIEDFSLEKRYC
ncbi:MAG: AAA family ATPase, partial [Cyanobacteria bacterium P01_A01_bin.17]